MEEWQQAMVRTEEHTRDIKDNIKNVATKDDLDAQTQYIVVELKPKNGIKDKMLWLLVIAIIVLAGAEKAAQIINGG